MEHYAAYKYTQRKNAAGKEVGELILLPSPEKSYFCGLPLEFCNLTKTAIPGDDNPTSMDFEGWARDVKSSVQDVDFDWFVWFKSREQYDEAVEKLKKVNI